MLLNFSLFAPFFEAVLLNASVAILDVAAEPTFMWVLLDRVTYKSPGYCWSNLGFCVDSCGQSCLQERCPFSFIKQWARC